MSAYYNNSKIFHHRSKLDALRDGRLTPPIHIRLKPTNRCNHHCHYCCYRSRNLLLNERMIETDEIPRAKMQELLEDFAVLGVKAVTFTGGGEPLCYPHLHEAVDRLSAAGISVALLTNGSLLEGEIAELLALRSVWIRVSIDGTSAEDYAKARHVSSSEFDKVCANLRHFASLPGRKSILGVNFIVTRQNANDISEFLKTAKDLGVQQVKLSLVVVDTTPAANRDYAAPILQKVKTQIEESLANLADSTFSIIDKVHLPDAAEEGFTPAHSRCPFIQCLSVIGADQNVYVCQDKAYTSSGLLGSIAKCRFAELWRSPGTRDRLFSLKPSQECHHHCVAQAKNTMLLEYLSAHDEHLDFV